MSSPYQEFVRKAKERYEENKKKKVSPQGGIEFTMHARYKMKQYGLSEQKVKSIIRYPRRTQTGIAPKTVAVMQPVSVKKRIGTPAHSGGEIWKQELWVMYQKQSTKKKQQQVKNNKHRNDIPPTLVPARGFLKIISAWRYPGMSPKGHPIPDEIWRELENGSILSLE